MVWMEISGNSAEDGPGSEVVGWNAAGSTRQQPVVRSQIQARCTHHVLRLPTTPRLASVRTQHLND